MSKNGNYLKIDLLRTETLLCQILDQKLHMLHVFCFVFSWKHKLLPLNVNMYIENGSKVQFSPMAFLLFRILLQ